MTKQPISAITLQRLQLVCDAFERATHREDFLLSHESWYTEWDLLYASPKRVAALKESNPDVDWDLTPRRPITRCVMGWAVLDPLIREQGLRPGREHVPYFVPCDVDGWDAIVQFFGAPDSLVYSWFGQDDPRTKDEVLAFLDSEIACYQRLMEERHD